MQSYHQPYQQGYCGLGNLRGNPDNNLRGKFGIANCLFRLAISARPCPVGSTARHTTPVADPSLPTTERGISDRGWQKTHKVQPGDMGGRSDRGYSPDTWVTQWTGDIGNTWGGFGGCFGGGQTGDLGNRPETWVTLRPGDVSHIWEPWAGLQRREQGADAGQKMTRQTGNRYSQSARRHADALEGILSHG